MFAYCCSNPVIRSDSFGRVWATAIAGGGSVGLGASISLGSLLNTAAAALGTLVPVGVVVVGIVVVVGVVYTAVTYAKTDDESNTDGRITSPIGRRNTYNTRKKAYEAAKKAGGGKEPRHDPNGHDDDNRAHFHPDVPNKYRRTPKGISKHDHYYYPR